MELFGDDGVVPCREHRQARLGRRRARGRFDGAFARPRRYDRARGGGGGTVFPSFKKRCHTCGRVYIAHALGSPRTHGGQRRSWRRDGLRGGGFRPRDSCRPVLASVASTRASGRSYRRSRIGAQDAFSSLLVRARGGAHTHCGFIFGIVTHHALRNGRVQPAAPRVLVAEPHGAFRRLTRTRIPLVFPHTDGDRGSAPAGISARSGVQVVCPASVDGAFADFAGTGGYLEMA